MPHKTVRLTPDLEREITTACKARGMQNPSAFIRTAIRNELTDRMDRIESVEQRIARALESLARESVSARNEVQALYSILDMFIRVFLTCVPEPGDEEYAAAVARAQQRYDKFTKAAGAAVSRAKEKALVAGGGE